MVHGTTHRGLSTPVEIMGILYRLLDTRPPSSMDLGRALPVSSGTRMVQDSKTDQTMLNRWANFLGGWLASSKEFPEEPRGSVFL